MRRVVAVIVGGWDALKDAVRRRRPPTCTITSVAVWAAPACSILSVTRWAPPVVTIDSVTVL